MEHVHQVHPVMSEAERIINSELLTEKLNQLNVFIGIKNPGVSSNNDSRLSLNH